MLCCVMKHIHTSSVFFQRISSLIARTRVTHERGSFGLPPSPHLGQTGLNTVGRLIEYPEGGALELPNEVQRGQGKVGRDWWPKAEQNVGCHASGEKDDSK